MSSLSHKRTNISFGLYNGYDESFDINFLENYVVKYQGEEYQSYYVLDADKIFVSKHEPFNGEFLNSKAIDIYEIVKKLNKKDTNKKECYEIHILQKALYGIYSRRSNQKMCR